MPGNTAHNLRRLALLDINYADLSFLFTLDRGESQSAHLGGEALAIFETTDRTPYAWNLHYHDVGHTLITGATGSGKSFLLNFLVTMAQRYDPFTVIFDLGHSYRKLARLMEGSYLELGLRHAGVRLNPFALDPTPENLHFLHAFVRVLLEGRGQRELTTRKTANSTTPSRICTSSTGAAAPVHGGQYAAAGDEPPAGEVDRGRPLRRPLRPRRGHADGAAVAGLRVRGDACVPRTARAAVVLRAPSGDARIQDPATTAALTLCVLDEAWRFIQHPTLRALRAGSPQDLAQAERRHEAGDPDRGRLRVGRFPADRRRELPDENLLWRIRPSTGRSTPNCSS